MSPERIVIFHHLEKCGGTTLLNYLREYYEEDKIVLTYTLFGANDTIFGSEPIYQERALSPDLKNKILNAQFIHDHYGLVFALTDPRIDRVVLFRDPLTRLISHWQMIARIPDCILERLPPEYSDIKKIANVSFKNFLLAIKNNHPTVRHLRNFYADHLLYNNLPLRKIYYETPLENLNIYKQSCLDALKKFNYIGLLEDYDTSMLMLCHHLNMPPPVKIEKFNARPSFQSNALFDEDTLALAEELLVIDRYVYQRATEIYAEQKELFLKKIPTNQDVHSYVQQNNHEQISQNAPVKQMSITMGQVLKGTGWHIRENDGTRVLRWTGPGDSADLDLRLLRSEPLLFTLTIVKYLSKERIINLKIFVDNEHVNKINIKEGIDTIVVKGILKSNEKINVTRFTIHTGGTDQAPGIDTRKLGVQVESLAVEPLNSRNIVNFTSLPFSFKKRSFHVRCYRLLRGIIADTLMRINSAFKILLLKINRRSF